MNYKKITKRSVDVSFLSKETKTHIKNWCDYSGWTLTQFSEIMNLVGFKSTVTLAFVEKNSKIVKFTYSSAGIKNILLLKYPDDIKIQNPLIRIYLDEEQYKEYRINYNFGAIPNTLKIALNSKYVLDSRGKELRCYYCIFFRTWNLDTDSIELEIQINGTENYIKRGNFLSFKNCNKLERWLINLELFDMDEIYKKICRFTAFPFKITLKSRISRTSGDFTIQKREKK